MKSKSRALSWRLASAFALSGAIFLAPPASAEEISSFDCETLLQSGHSSATLKYSGFLMSPQEFDDRMRNVESALEVWDHISETIEFADAYARSDSALRRLRKVYTLILSRDSEEEVAQARPLTVGLSKELDLLRRMALMDQRMSQHSHYLGIAMLFQHRTLDRDRGYLRLSFEQAQSYRVHIQDGRLFNARGKSLHAMGDHDAIYVLSVDGDLYVKVRARRGFFHHSSFLNGGDVAAAGKFQIDQGRLLKISDHSGHYAVPRVLTAQLFDHLLKSRVPLQEVDIDWLSPAESAPAPGSLRNLNKAIDETGMN